MKILIIEDNPKNMKLAVDILTKTGHTVLQAVEASHGLELADQELPDLVLMDIQLPGMDGLAATRKLKKGEKTGPIPVIALTAYAMKGDQQKIMAAGCDDYIAKPIRLQPFLDKIEEWQRKIEPRPEGE